MNAVKTYEEAVQKLDAILAKLSDESTPLDEAVELYAQAAELIGFCNKTLKEASLKIETITQKLAQEES